jgi:hypothetical protein
MIEIKKAYESLDFKVRSWLIRLISGKHRADLLATKADKAILHASIENMYQTLTEQTHQMMSKTTARLSKELLAQFVSANQHLSESQKAAIASIIDAQAVNNSANYLR